MKTTTKLLLGGAALAALYMYTRKGATSTIPGTVNQQSQLVPMHLTATNLTASQLEALANAANDIPLGANDNPYGAISGVGASWFCQNPNNRYKPECQNNRGAIHTLILPMVKVSGVKNTYDLQRSLAM